MNMMKTGTLLVGLALAGAVGATANHVMVQPKDAVIIAGGAGFGSIVNTYNQAGLAIPYVDEVTPAHPYLALPPMHTSTFACCEWFSDSGTTSAEVSYLVVAKRPRGINHFTLWNEESCGIGTFDLWYGATPGAKADLVLSGISPFDNPLADYAPEWWHFAERPKAGWWTLVMTGCPQPDPGSFPSCAIGEVAFAGDVPEPGVWAMLIAGFGLVGTAVRRRRDQIATA